MTGIEDVDPLLLYFSDFLHEDWMYEFESPEAAFEHLLTLPSRLGLRRLVKQLDDLLDMNHDELKARLYRYSPYLDVSQDLGISEYEWLQSLRHRAAAELAARTATDR